MKDSKLTGVFTAISYIALMPTLMMIVLRFALDYAQYFNAIFIILAFVPPIYFYKMGMRMAMKSYLFTLFVPILAILLLFGSCVLMFRG